MDSKIKRGGTVLFWLCWIAYTTSYITRLNLFYRYVDNDCGRAF